MPATPAPPARLAAAALALAALVLAVVLLALALGAVAPLGAERFGAPQRVCAAGCEDLFRTDVYTGTEPR